MNARFERLAGASFAIACALAFASAAGAQNAKTGVAFDAAGFAQYAKAGQGRIDGWFVTSAAGSSALPRSGATIECFPALPYTMRSLASDAHTPFAGDARLASYARVTKTGADGGFHFERLPRGRYVLRATLIAAFPRIVHDPLQLAARAVYDAPAPVTGGNVVYDYTRAWFVSEPVYVGLRRAGTPAFHLVARRDRFDPRR